MSRLFYRYDHVGEATRTTAGQATGGIRCGDFIDGQLVVRVTGLGVGGKLTPYWQSSADGSAWGDLTRGATMTATGTKIIAMAGGIGNYARARWTVATAAKFSIMFTFKE
jgi:hypothetical protein